MDDKLRNDLILLAVASVLAAFAWVMRGLIAAVNTLALRAESTVSKEQHNEAIKSVREAHNALARDVAILYDRGDRR